MFFHYVIMFFHYVIPDVSTLCVDIAFAVSFISNITVKFLVTLYGVYH
jgi:hypothetical protein